LRFWCAIGEIDECLAESTALYQFYGTQILQPIVYGRGRYFLVANVFEDLCGRGFFKPRDDLQALKENIAEWSLTASLAGGADNGWRFHC
jgi:hypothetical protein